MFISNKKGNLEYLTVAEFEKTGLVRHAFSTRYGGVSSGIYSSMNLRFNCQDAPENVLKNFDILASEVGIDYKKLVLTKQVHEDIIKEVDKSFCGNGIMYDNRFESADGLICAERGVPLTVFGADCLTVMFLDKKNGVIATAHSGWRGTINKISQKCAHKMINEYNSRPDDLIAAIGPSIRICHYEVSDSLAQSFFDEFGEEAVKKFNDRWHVDMQRCVRLQLEDVGVFNVVDSGLCTYCESDRFFSHRKTNGARGVMVGIIELI